MGALWYEWLLIDPNVVFSAWLYLQGVFCILRTQTVSGHKPLLVLCVSNFFFGFGKGHCYSVAFLEFVIFLRLSWVEESKHVLLYLCLGVGVEAMVVLSQSLSSLSSMGSVLSRSFQQTSLHVSIECFLFLLYSFWQTEHLSICLNRLLHSQFMEIPRMC